MPSRFWSFGSRRGRFVVAAASAAAFSMLSIGCAGSTGSSGASSVSGESSSTSVQLESRTVTQRAEPFQKLGYRLNWTIGETGGEGTRTRMLDLADDLLLVHDVRNNLTARQLSNGRTLWVANLGEPLNKFLGNLRVGDRIVASGESEVLILNAKTGQLEDRQRLAVLANTAPALADGYMLVFGSPRGEVFGHDIRIGLKRWGFALNQRVRGNPVMIGRIAGVVAESGQVLLVNPVNGEAITGLKQIYGGVVNNPISDGVNMYIASTDQSIYAFGSTTGDLLWRVRTQSRLEAQPTVHDGVLYQFVPDEGLVAITTSNGTRRWANPEAQGTVVAVRNGDLVVWTGSQGLLVDVASGDVLERVDLPGVREIIADGFVDGDLIVLSGQSALARFSSR